MNLDKAIKILKEDVQLPTAKFTPDLRDAELLGIEALKRLEDARVSGYYGLDEPLPGEGEE